MTDVFRDIAGIDYPILDSDAHVHEPPELWQERVPSKWKARAPKVDHTEEGDVWVFDEGRWPIGLTATAGQSHFDYRPFGGRYAEIRPGAFETDARLADMDADGIYAQIIYPSVTLTGAKILSGEPELQDVCVRAYNEWMVDFCAGSGGRLIGQAVIPMTGIEAAVKEVDWALKHDHRGVILSCFPNGTLEPKPEDDRFWAIAQEAKAPVAIHTGSFMREELSASDPSWWSSFPMLAKAGKMRAGSETIPVACDLLFSRVLERFPDLRFVLAESNIGWIPTLLEQTDEVFRQMRWMMDVATDMTTMPSEIFRRNFWATFIIDSVGIELRHRMNQDHLMWSTDYPHSASPWPDSVFVLERQFRGVPSADVKKMLHTNCKELYALDVPELKPR